MNNLPINCQPCCDPCAIIHSIALQEMAIADILVSESKKIQKALSINNVTVEQLLCVNQSVTNTIRGIVSLEVILLNKLEEACAMPQSSCHCDPIPTMKKVNIKGKVVDECGNTCVACINARGISKINIKTDKCGYYEVNGLLVNDSFFITAISHNGCYSSVTRSINNVSQQCYNINLVMRRNF